MHEKAKERMRQLIRAWLSEVVLVGDTVDFGFVHSQTGYAIETLLFKQFGQWLDSYPRTSIAILIFNELKRSNLLQAEGAEQARLADTQSADTPDKESEIRERSVSIGREEVKEQADTYLREHYRNADGDVTCQICKGPLPFKLDDGREYFEVVEFLPELRETPPTELSRALPEPFGDVSAR
jgi:hypothetical protein